MSHHIVLVRRDIGHLLLHALKACMGNQFQESAKKNFVLMRNFYSKQGNFWELQLDKSGSNVFKLQIFYKKVVSRK